MDWLLLISVLSSAQRFMVAINHCIYLIHQVRLCLEHGSFSNFQEKSKEKKVIPGRKEEETKKKKLTVVDSQVSRNLI